MSRFDGRTQIKVKCITHSKPILESRSVYSGFMKKILHIIASPREDASHSLQVAQVFLQNIKHNYPDLILDELNLAKEDLPPLSVKNVSGKYVLLEGKDLFGRLKESWSEIIQYIEQFLSADFYVISTPMWNFNIPYMLKHYIDLIVQPKYLFRHAKTGVEGLVKNKKMLVVTSMGGSYDTETSRNFDFQEPYLRTIFGFIGIKEMAFIKVEGMDTGSEEQVKKRLEEALFEAQKLGSGWEL